MSLILQYNNKQLSWASRLLSVLNLEDDFEDYVFARIYELVSIVVITCNTCTFL